MSILSIIVAIDANHAIGRNNQLLCYLPNDLKYFKSRTQGHTIIMGRKTFDSLPNGTLPNRRNIVLSRNPNLKIENCEIFSSLKDALQILNNDEEVFIIGGASIYKEAIKWADKLYITQIHYTFEDADTYFPTIDETEWEQIARITNPADEKNKFAHDFILYKRK